MENMMQVSKKAILFNSVAVLGMTVGLSAWAQSGSYSDPNSVCADNYAVLPEECIQGNATTVVRMPAEPNTEWDAGRVDNDAGFVLAIDGEPIDADPRVEDRIRKTDIALANADIRIQYDGLEVTPRLDLKMANATAVGEGGIARFESQLNYPRFVTRGEIRLIDRLANGGQKLVATVPIDPNGTVDIAVPAGRDLVAVHRVYDARGRYDETAALPLSSRDDRGLTTGEDDGTTTLARQRIPVFGGAVTVSSNNVSPGAVVQTMGETVRPDASGSFVIQRIMPPGEYEIDVSVDRPSQQFARSVDIPNSDLFYVGVIDVTAGWRDSDDAAIDDSYSHGRIAFYVKSKYANGVTVTASADTTEENLSDIFKNLTEKDPRSVIERVDPASLYPTYGDDSTSVDDTPTSGRVFVRVEKDGNYAMWGDYQARLNGNHFVRNERQLYGAAGQWSSVAQTSAGEARATVSLYAAEPDSLPGRDVFQGTGGSVYFLQRQDVMIGTETLTVELRDALTGRVLDRVSLAEGTDYSINYIQGVIILNEPLTSSIDTGLIQTNAGGDVTVNLVAQYEYAPTATDIDGYSFGARAEAWVTDKVRVGVSGTQDTTSTDDQTAVAADLLYQHSENSFVRLDFARTEGPGYAQSFSTDGGLIINNSAATAGTGESVRLEGKLDFADLGSTNDGYIGFYAERRDEGFQTLDYQVLAATGDEELWGIFVESKPNDRLRFAVSYDDYSNGVGDTRQELGAEVGYQFSDTMTLSFGAELLDTLTGGVAGSRTDVALRLDADVSDDVSWYVFGQATVDSDGLADNNRFGVGGSYALSDTWNVEGEINDGSNGLGGRLMFRNQRDDNSSLYFGYELDPGRQIGNGGIYGDDKGQYVVGGRRQINDQVSYFAENTYDAFSARNSLTSAYGVSYQPTSFLTYDGAVEVARVEDATDGDFDRTALSFGVRYEDEETSARARLELRKERGVLGGTSRDADTILLSATARHKISENARLVFSAQAASTDTDQSSILDGELVDVQLGYAFRPVDNDKLNVLAKYRFLYDMYGQRIDGADVNGLRQKSHVFSLDADYDINNHWVIGGKIGGRLSETAAAGSNTFVENNAWIGVLNARYHLVHNWDAGLEARFLKVENQSSQTGVVGTVYRHIGNNVKLGVGYNFGSFSDDLTDQTYDDQGVFLNLIAKF